jgi:hypothetical protein
LPRILLCKSGRPKRQEYRQEHRREYRKLPHFNPPYSAALIELIRLNAPVTCDYFALATLKEAGRAACCVTDEEYSTPAETERNTFHLAIEWGDSASAARPVVRVELSPRLVEGNLFNDHVGSFASFRASARRVRSTSNSGIWLTAPDPPPCQVRTLSSGSARSALTQSRPSSGADLWLFVTTSDQSHLTI